MMYEVTAGEGKGAAEQTGVTFWALYSTSRMLLSSSMQASSSSPLSISSRRTGTTVCSSSSRHSGDRWDTRGWRGCQQLPAQEGTRRKGTKRTDRTRARLGWAATHAHGAANVHPTWTLHGPCRHMELPMWTLHGPCIHMELPTSSGGAGFGKTPDLVGRCYTVTSPLC